jgi:hypothetical protein
MGKTLQGPYNPILVSSLAAKLLGFLGKVTHGNLVVGMLVERLMLGEMQFRRKVYYLEVGFKRPMVVPSDLRVVSLNKESSGNLNTGRFEVVSANSDSEEKVYIQGRAGPM